VPFQRHRSETSVQPAIRWFRECFFVPRSSLRGKRAAAQAAPKTDATIDGDWIFCNLLFRSSNGVAEMKGIAARFGWFGGGLFCLLTVGWVLASPQGKPLLKGLPMDWTHRHVIFSQPATAEQARLLANEPQFWQQGYRRQALSSSITQSERARWLAPLRFTFQRKATSPVERPALAVAPFRHRNRHYSRLRLTIDTKQGSPMAINDLPSDNPSTPAAKKPYEKPAFRCEKVFVTRALSCGKISITQANCTSTTPKAS
jgi:hypothetical protein